MNFFQSSVSQTSFIMFFIFLKKIMKKKKDYINDIKHFEYTQWDTMPCS